MSETNLADERYLFDHSEALALAARLAVLHDLDPLLRFNEPRQAAEEMPPTIMTALSSADGLVELTRPERIVGRRLKRLAEQDVKAVVYDAQTPAPKRITEPKTQGATRTEKEGEEDSLHKCLIEIGRYPLLNRDKEVLLAKMIHKGNEAQNKLNELADYNNEDTEALLRSIETGKSAKEWFIKTNLRLVVSIAKRYQNSGLPLLDLIQEGNISLDHAVDLFDWRKGFKFSTYATWWITQAITRGIANTGRAVRLPVHSGDALRGLNKARMRLEQETGRTPSMEEIAEELGISVEKAYEITKHGRLEPTSLDAPVGSGSSSRFNSSETVFSDLIPDSRVDVQEASMAYAIPEAVRKALSELDNREQEVMVLRFGLDRGEARTLEEVGIYFGLTRERIRQIEARALSKLRHPSSSAKDLLQLLED